VGKELIERLGRHNEEGNVLTVNLGYSLRYRRGMEHRLSLLLLQEKGARNAEASLQEGKGRNNYLKRVRKLLGGGMRWQGESRHHWEKKGYFSRFEQKGRTD